MHDELVKRLRELQTITEHCDEQSCDECENRELCDKYDNKTLSGTYNEAADAIERLEAALILMVLQYCTDDDGTLYHQFMCAGEGAFDALGITLKTNPQVLWDRLDEIEAKEKQRRKADEL